MVLRRRARISAAIKSLGPLVAAALGQILSAWTDLDSETLLVARSFLVNHVRRRVFASQCVEETNDASSSSLASRSIILSLSSIDIFCFSVFLNFIADYLRGYDFAIPIRIGTRNFARVNRWHNRQRWHYLNVNMIQNSHDWWEESASLHDTIMGISARL